MITPTNLLHFIILTNLRNNFVFEAYKKKDTLSEVVGRHLENQK